ncbi:MAG TPA: hypothetical protein P5526_23770 [Anaerolineae bacterium]|nr:hypothetical protein [Anaerolineae bacterium]
MPIAASRLSLLAATGCSKNVCTDDAKVTTWNYELLGERIIIDERIGRAHGPSPGPILFVRIEDTVLAVELAAVMGRVVVEETVQLGLRPVFGRHHSQ